MSEHPISLRTLQELIRPKAAGDEYLRGLFNGIDMALAVLGDMPFRPIFPARLFGDKPDPAPIETPTEPEKAEDEPETVTPPEPKKHPGRPRIPICPKCKTREKAPGKPYCPECAREHDRLYKRRRREAKKGQNATTAPEAPETPEPPEAPTRRRGGSKNAKLYAPDAPETPTAPEQTAENQYDRLIAECKKRGYDADLMLGMARALPRISFRKSGCYLVPTLRRPKEDNEA